MNVSLLLVIVSILLSSFGQIAMKYGTLKLTNLDNLTIFQKLIEYFMNLYVVSGFLLYGISAVVWIFAISKLPLSIAYPMVGLSYVLVMILSYFIFNEPITIIKVIGMVLITSGVIVIAKA
ncbi:EamA family transporter [Paenibacillus marinisediminis]